MSYKNLTYKVVRREDGPRSTKYLKDAQRMVVKWYEQLLPT
jgi:hypothetical protein